MIIFVVFFPLIKINKLSFRLFALVRVVYHHLQYLINHLALLVHQVPLLVGFNLRKIFTQIAVQPNPYLPIFIDAHLFLTNEKSTYFIVQLFITLQHSHHTVQIVWIGDIFELAESTFNMVKISGDCVGGGAELPSLVSLEVKDLDDEGLVSPPLEGLNVVVIIIFGG